MKTYIKHMMSTAADWFVEYEIDKDKKTVEMVADRFDSALCLNLILSLQRDGTNCVRDDTKHIGWTPYPEYKTFLTMTGLRFQVATHRLVDVGSEKDRYTIVLTLVPQS